MQRGQHFPKSQVHPWADFFLKSGDYYSEFGKVIFQKKKPLSFSDRGFNKT
jgi:hypothetical protein